MKKVIKGWTISNLNNIAFFGKLDDQLKILGVYEERGEDEEWVSKPYPVLITIEKLEEKK